MNAAEALQEFLRPPQPVRNLKREEAILGQTEVSRIVIAPGTENEREEIAVYRWGDGDRRALLFHCLGGKICPLFASIGSPPDPGFAAIEIDAPTHAKSSRGFCSRPAFAPTRP